jgi:hypothetical protein
LRLFKKNDQIKITNDNPSSNFDEEGDAQVTALTINKTEDVLYLITSTNQLMKVNNINLDGSEDKDLFNFQYVHSAFHSVAITGMDVCLRKELIVTCSARAINIWNYKHMTLEISQKTNVNDPPQAVAFHPSGFHILVAVGDKISMMNVLSASIKEYNSVPMKACREIKFSNGGHLFAASGQSTGIWVYNFYTAECPSNMQCKGHTVVKGIDWFDDDSGFCSCGGDQAYFYNLQQYRDTKTRMIDSDLTVKNTVFAGIVNFPSQDGNHDNALVVGNDKKVRLTKDQNNFG